MLQYQRMDFGQVLVIRGGCKALLEGQGHVHQYLRKMVGINRLEDNVKEFEWEEEGRV